MGVPRAFLRHFSERSTPGGDGRGGPFASMRPRREVLLTTFADPSTFPSVFDSPETPDIPTEAAPEKAAVKTFDELGLPGELVRVLNREGITTPFEIQA